MLTNSRKYLGKTLLDELFQPQSWQATGIKLRTLYDTLFLTYKNIKAALKDKGVLANSEEKMLFFSIIPEYGVLGVPDKVDCTNGIHPIIIEIKTTKRLPSKPWFNDKIQVSTYALGLERIGFRADYSIIEYVDRDRPSSRVRYKISLNEELKNKIEFTAKRVIGVLEGYEQPIPPKKQEKCKVCEPKYRAVCKWKLY
ncbi:MAG: Dna2/Cas4 domain-containing protein [archaeon]|nr:Dna2/Cas4 domain-containing protein [archaeon]